MEQVENIFLKFGFDAAPLLTFIKKYKILLAASLGVILTVAANSPNYRVINTAMQHSYLETRGQAPEQLAQIAAKKQQDDQYNEHYKKLDDAVKQLAAIHIDGFKSADYIFNNYKAAKAIVMDQSAKSEIYTQYDISPALAASHAACESTSTGDQARENLLGCMVYLNTHDKFIGYSSQEPLLIVALAARLSGDDSSQTYNVNDLLIYSWLKHYEKKLKEKIEPEPLPALTVNGSYNPALFTNDLNPYFAWVLINSLTGEEAIRLNGTTYTKLQQIADTSMIIYHECVIIQAKACIE